MPPSSNKQRLDQLERRRAKRKAARLMRKSKKQNGVQMVSAPAASSAVVTSERPKINGSSRKGVTRIDHRELVRSNVKGGIDFNVSAVWAGQPGLSVSFPWLSKTASNFDQYLIHSMSAEWVPSAPTNTPGKVTIAPDYDALDAPPQSTVAVANYANAKTFPVWHNVVVPLDVKALMGMGPRKYIRTSKVLNSDLKTYDCCNVFVCTQNFTDVEHAAGDLFINYDIEFFAPEVALGGTASVARSYTDLFSLAERNVPVSTIHLESADTIEPFNGDDGALVQANNWIVEADGVTLSCQMTGYYSFNRSTDCVTTGVTGGIGTFFNLLEGFGRNDASTNFPEAAAIVIEDAFGGNGAQLTNQNQSFRLFSAGDQIFSFPSIGQVNTSGGTVLLTRRQLLISLLA